jgi:hypothetical protein
VGDRKLALACCNTRAPLSSTHSHPGLFLPCSPRCGEPVYRRFVSTDRSGGPTQVKMSRKQGTLRLFEDGGREQLSAALRATFGHEGEATP